MKTKFFMLLAAVLLSASAFAQSENTGTLKGDVNGDGVVDVADINAIIQIMKDGGGTGEETKYYWYAGQTQPSSISGTPTVDDTNFTVNKWHTLGTATTIGKTITGGTSGQDWYVAVPTSVNLKPTASDLSTPNTSWDNIETITVNGVSYTIWRTNSTGTRSAVYMAGTGEETKYYWYVGQTQPTSMTSVTPQDSGTFTNNNWHTINVNNTYSFSNPIYNSESNPISGDSKTYWYVALPADKSYGIYDSDDVNEVTAGNITKVSTITIANVTYNVYKTAGTLRNFIGWRIH